VGVQILKRLISLLSVFVVLVICLSSNARSVANVDVSAQYAVLVDATSGSVIFGKNEHQRASMASTTKIMTALILCENANLDEEITVTDAMVRVEGSSMGLLEGDKVHYRDLLYGLLLASGNDAANAVALSLGGSFEGFAKLMNERAKQIGMNNTNFVTPSGLDDENHYSTAYDMALLACEAVKNADFAAACASESARLEYGNPPYWRTLRNHNKLLRIYENCVGIKTGFTKKSGRCLVSCAKNGSKKVIAVTLNASDDWNDHIKLLDFGINSLETRIINHSDNLPKIKVIGGNERQMAIYMDDIELSMIPSDFDRIKFTVETTDLIFSPVKKGAVIGKIILTVDGKEVARVNCFAAADVELSVNEIDKNVKYWFRRLMSA